MAEAGRYSPTIIGRRRFIASVSDADGRKWSLCVEGRTKDEAGKAAEPMLRAGETLHGLVEQ